MRSCHDDLCSRAWSIESPGKLPHMSCTRVCLCVPAKRAVTFSSPIPLPAHFSRWFDWGTEVLLHIFQMALYAIFCDIPLVAILCIAVPQSRSLKGMPNGQWPTQPSMWNVSWQQSGVNYVWQSRTYVVVPPFWPWMLPVHPDNGGHVRHELRDNLWWLNSMNAYIHAKAWQPLNISNTCLLQWHLGSGTLSSNVPTSDKVPPSRHSHLNISSWQVSGKLVGDLTGVDSPTLR